MQQNDPTPDGGASIEPTSPDGQSAKRILAALEAEAARDDVSPSLATTWTTLAANVRRELFTTSG